MIKSKTLREKKKLLVTSNDNISSLFSSSQTSFKNTKIGSTGCHYIILYRTIKTFNDPKKEGFGKHCGKRRKCW